MQAKAGGVAGSKGHRQEGDGELGPACLPLQKAPLSPHQDTQDVHKINTLCEAGHGGTYALRACLQEATPPESAKPQVWTRYKPALIWGTHYQYLLFTQ